MFKNKISVLSFIVISSSLLVACGKSEDNKETPKDNTQVEQTNKKEENTLQEIKHINKVSFKDLSELKSFSKVKMKEFENILKSNELSSGICFSCHIFTVEKGSKY